MRESERGESDLCSLFLKRMEGLGADGPLPRTLQNESTEVRARALPSCNTPLTDTLFGLVNYYLLGILICLTFYPRGPSRPSSLSSLL